jgi:hypothetical protein
MRERERERERGRERESVCVCLCVREPLSIVKYNRSLTLCAQRKMAFIQGTQVSALKPGPRVESTFWQFGSCSKKSLHPGHSSQCPSIFTILSHDFVYTKENEHSSKENVCANAQSMGASASHSHHVAHVQVCDSVLFQNKMYSSS